MQELEEWLSVEGFPRYSVSSLGRVRNDKTGYILALMRNQQGIISVGLGHGHRSQYKRSVARLVARAFLPNPSLPNFNTPIHLNGDLTDCRATNLMWRPRWFAVKYHQQFHNDRRGIRRPVREIHTGEVFHTSWDAAVRYGLLDREILLAIKNRTYVSPTFQVFEEVET